MLSIDGVSVRYGGIVALREVSIEVREGESVLLVGSNGAGKSSLINAVIGLVPIESGRIIFDGKDLSKVSCVARAPGDRLLARRAARVRIADGDRKRAVGRCRLPASQAQANLQWIRRISLLSERGSQPAGQLSGGEQQIVALARAVSTFPKLLLLDEPFLGLAPVWISRISEAIRQLQQRGTTILMTEQMARPALRLVDRAYVMRGGEVRRSGPVAEIRDIALADEYL
jgi:branched-chain amino acid transport system ATP-binding protein